MLKIGSGFKGLDFLKWLAIITMVLDHIAIIFFLEGEFVYNILRILGRIAFPLFLFILIYNYFYNTKNKGKYIFRLLLFAIISEPIYWIVMPTSGLNIFWSLALSLIFINLFEKLIIFKEKIIKINRINLYLRFIFLSIILFLSAFFLSLKMSYGILGLGVAISFYFWIRYKNIYSFFILFISLFFLNLNFLNPFFILFSWIPLGIIFLTLHFYKKEDIKVVRNKFNKYFFYVFYPIHLIILNMIKEIFF